MQATSATTTAIATIPPFDKDHAAPSEPAAPPELSIPEALVGTGSYPPSSDVLVVELGEVVVEAVGESVVDASVGLVVLILLVASVVAVLWE